MIGTIFRRIMIFFIFLFLLLNSESQSVPVLGEVAFTPPRTSYISALTGFE